MNHSLSERQREVARDLDQEGWKSSWTDWKWHIRHGVRDLEGFERLLGTRFDERRRRALERTAARFPLAVTPLLPSRSSTPRTRSTTPCSSSVSPRPASWTSAAST
jgi:Lysine 2,3-aminomutase